MSYEVNVSTMCGYIGFDPRECDAFMVALSTFNRAAPPVPIRGLVLSDLREAGLYWRPTREIWEEVYDKAGRVVGRRRVLYDEISEHSMATEFAISRFLVYHVTKQRVKPSRGWVLFADCDQMMLPGTDLLALFTWAEREQRRRAVLCVKHNHAPKSETKMDGQPQSKYNRKNWSSFMMINLGHEANYALTPDLINSVPGRDLHDFCWLPEPNKEELIGELPIGWNWLVGSSPDVAKVFNVHFTEGVPSMHGYENAPYADIWRSELARCAAAGAHYP